jgi:hypothetical protein
MGATVSSIYLPEEKKTYKYIRPAFLPEAALLLEATLPPGTRPAELSATSAYLNYTNVRAYEPANSNRNAAYSQHL